MDTATMKDAGYRVSAQVSDEEVVQAAADVEAAYIRPILDFDRPTAVVQAAIMQLTYILLLRRHAVATRSGGKVKLSPSLSDTAGPTQQDLEEADRRLRAIQASTTDATQGIPSKLVDDIAGLYFRKTFLGL